MESGIDKQLYLQKCRKRLEWVLFLGAYDPIGIIETLRALKNEVNLPLSFALFLKIFIMQILSINYYQFEPVAFTKYLEPC